MSSLSPEFVAGFSRSAADSPDHFDHFELVVTMKDEPRHEEAITGTTVNGVYDDIVEGSSGFGLGFVARVEYEHYATGAEYEIAETAQTLSQFERECEEADLVLSNWMRDRGIAGWKGVAPGNHPV